MSGYRREADRLSRAYVSWMDGDYDGLQAALSARGNDDLPPREADRSVADILSDPENARLPSFTGRTGR